MVICEKNNLKIVSHLTKNETPLALRHSSFLACTPNWPVALFLLLLHPPRTLCLLTFDCAKTFSLSNATWKPIYSNSLSPPVLRQASLYLRTIKALYKSVIIIINIIIIQYLIEVSVFCRHTCAKTPTPLVNCIVNDGLVSAMPNMQKTSLQFTTLV